MKSFVISPIGEPNTPVREHADDVYECVIRPALEQTGVMGFRADHVKDVGRISEQMFADILSSDFCIGLLAGFNPNVFYEIAIAHSAGIPVILLCQQGVMPPFDLKDERVFHYDLSPRKIASGENAKRLAELIDSVRKLKGRRQVPFGDNLTPLNGRSGVQGVRLSRESIAAAADWTSLVDRVQRRFYVSAMGLTGWKGISGLRESLQALGKRDCDVRILTMDGANPALSSMTNANISHAGAYTLAPLIDGARDWLQDALKGNARAAVRAITKGAALQQIIVADDVIRWSPYLYSATTMHSPCFEIDAESALFSVVLGEFEALWEANEA